MDDLFDTVQGCKYFSKLDLHSGYNQVRIREEDIPKTAINTVTPLGHFQFKVMGFGLCNAPATFQSLMNEVLRPYLRKVVVVFLDDILIFSRTWEEHLEHVRIVFYSTSSTAAFCKPSKSLFGAIETLYLGNIITGLSIALDPKKLEAVRDWPVPNSVSEVRSFLGFVNYFRRFIPRYAELARHLDEITGKHARFSWNESRQKSLESLKSALLNPPVLQLADTSRPFILHTDASDLAIGAVLLQADELEQHPVAYASRKLTFAKRNYTIAERETLAVIFALQTWQLYLFKHFDIFTDNQAVVYLRSKPRLSKHKARWAEFLAEFHFSIRHIPGRENTAAILVLGNLSHDYGPNWEVWSSPYTCIPRKRKRSKMVMQTTGNSLISSTVFALLVITIRSEISISGARRTNGCTWSTRRLHACVFRRVPDTFQNTPGKPWLHFSRPPGLRQNLLEPQQTLLLAWYGQISKRLRSNMWLLPMEQVCEDTYWSSPTNSYPSEAMGVNQYYRERKRFLYCALGALGEREIQRKRERERVRWKWRHLSSAEIGDDFCTFPCQNVHLSIGEEFCTFPCQKFAPLSRTPLLNGAEFTLPLHVNTLHPLRRFYQMAWQGIEAPKQTIEFPAAPSFSSKNESN